ncbi:hypothetical protein QM276_17415, partial [Acinetobacter baumannii]
SSEDAKQHEFKTNQTVWVSETQLNLIADQVAKGIIWGGAI